VLAIVGKAQEKGVPCSFVADRKAKALKGRGRVGPEADCGTREKREEGSYARPNEKV